MSFNQPFPNPYGQSIPDFQPETIPLDEIIRQAIWGQMLNFRVCIPAQVTTVLGNQKVHVQPLLQTRYRADQAVVNLPVIQNVPVNMPIGQNYEIKLPVAIGDTGYVIISDRSLDLWMHSSGGIIDPQDSRQHFLQDAIFVPGLLPFSQQTTDLTSDLIVRNGSAQMRWLTSGLFKIANNSTTLNTLLQQLISNIEDLVTAVNAITVTTPISVPSTPFTGTATSGTPNNSSDITDVTTELMSTANAIAGLLE